MSKKPEDPIKEKELISPQDLYIVGIGTSAGGLEELKTFFSNSKPMHNVAYVVIQHLSTDYKSYMVEIISKITELPVVLVKDGVKIEPNTIYMIPPGEFLTIQNFHLHLSNREKDDFSKLAINHFFSSLAREVKNKAIGIILSGSGSDGTNGIEEIKNHGGAVFVQEASTAKFESMPKSAIQTGLVDYVCKVSEMHPKIAAYIENPYLLDQHQSELLEDDYFDLILEKLDEKFSIDFSKYKEKTLLRRIGKRMGIAETDELEDYYYYFMDNENEKQYLYQDLLIGVTKLFRDPEAFEILEDTVIPKIFDARKDDKLIRVWIPGVSTGEEAYTVSILLHDFMDQIQIKFQIKIFATDIDDRALQKASKAIFQDVDNVPKRYLDKYFTKSANDYRIADRIRQSIIFSNHNLMADPPFLDLDLVSCRNVLIYLKPEAQEKILSLFSFSLRDQAYLLLGASETLGKLASNFDTIHSKWNIYQFIGNSKEINISNLINLKGKGSSPARYNVGNKNRVKIQNDLILSVNRELIHEFVPPSILINESYEILQIYGDINRFLHIPPGVPSKNLQSLANDEISTPLSIASRKAFRDGETINYRDIAINSPDGKNEIVSITARPYFSDSTHRKVVHITFRVEEIEKEEQGENITQIYANDQLEKDYRDRISELKEELKTKQENLQATIEELETSNEELQSTNEELLASNEELQSTNEELQSVNEELNTVNSEYQTKIEELLILNNDLDNLLISTKIGYIFLNADLHVRKFSQNLQKVINLKEIDVNRPITDITTNFKNYDLTADVRTVHKAEKKFIQTEVTDLEETNHQIQIRHYINEQNDRDGIVVTVTNLPTQMKTLNLGKNNDHFND